MAASEKQKKWSKNYREKVKGTAKYKQRVKVRNKVTNAVRDGRKKKPTKCPHCGRTDTRIEWHHTGYGGEGKGEWRCSACNRRPGQTKK